MNYYFKYVNIQFVPSNTDKSCPNNQQSFFYPHHTSYTIHNELCFWW